MPKPLDNLRPHDGPKFAWYPANVPGSLESLRLYCHGLAGEAIAWYGDGKKVLKWWARKFRVWSIVLVIAAALLPTLGELFGEDGKNAIPANGMAEAKVVLG